MHLQPFTKFLHAHWCMLIQYLWQLQVHIAHVAQGISCYQTVAVVL